VAHPVNHQQEQLMADHVVNSAMVMEQLTG